MKKYSDETFFHTAICAGASQIAIDGRIEIACAISIRLIATGRSGMEINMEIIYEDKKMMIVRKEAGKLSQSGKSFERDLTGEVLLYRKKKGEMQYAALINRLDRPVSGLVLFAKDKAEAARLSKLMQNEGLCKRYKAIICGRPESDKGIFEDYLCKDERSNVSRVVDEKTYGAKYAKLEYEFVKEIHIGQNLYSLVNIRLITGRHHQIRVQFAQRNMPILCDVKYGGEKAAFDRGSEEAAKVIKLSKNEIALCAYSLKVDNKEYTTGQTWINE
ncbi:MAG: RluA family pseudouridine synthase [Lachnospira sp.]